MSALSSERVEERRAGPRVCGLSSARDRARLRERQVAERARVERVLARGPREPALRQGERDDAVACRVCGSERVVEDEVSDGVRWCLARCLRCEHRWTERAGEGFRPLVRRPLRAKAANGA